ncbi:MAG: hypothetical protein HY862_07210 [Chloroflexi bacterium]|nr:hypothetical protein [Chloroflexota bacterium]
MTDHHQISSDSDSEKKKLEQAEPMADQESPDYFRQGIGIALSGQGGDDGGDLPENHAAVLHDPRLSVQTRRNMALSIGRTRGNQYLQRMVTQPSQTGVGAVSLVQRGIFSADKQMTVDEIIDSKDSDNVNDTNMPAILAASPDKKAMIISLIHSNSWVGPSDEYKLEKIWDSMGVKGIEAYFTLFQQSVDYGVEYEGIPCLKDLKEKFKQDTQGLALKYLNSNQELVKKEMDQLGIDAESGKPNQSLGADQEKRLKEIQEAAGILGDAMQAKHHLDQLQVGYTTKNKSSPPLATIRNGYGRTFVWEQYFHEGPPEMTSVPGQGRGSDKLQPYSEVKAHYDEMNGIIEGYSTKYPGLYPLAQAGRLEELVKADSPQAVQSLMGEGLRDLAVNIKKSIPMISSNDLDYRDLLPIHGQLMAGTAGGKFNWASPVGKFIIKEEVEGHESAQFWTSLGLGALAAAAFVIAELATFGTATFWIAAAAGVGAGVVQAGMSIENWADMSTASKSAVSPSSQLIYEGQVSAAALAAVLDTVFAFIDAAGVGLKAIRAGGLTAKSLARPAVDKIVTETAKNAEKELIAKLPSIGANAEGKETLEKAISQLGVNKAKDASGKSYEEMIEILGKENPIAQRIRDVMKRGPISAADINLYKKDLKMLAEDVRLGFRTVQEADQIAMILVEELGPLEVVKRSGGWKALNSSTVFGKSTAAGQAMEAWRQSLIKEVNEFMDKMYGGGAKRTGTPGNISDLDVSQTGKKDAAVSSVDAAKHRDAAVEYLAQKLGAEPSELNKLLDTDLFVDPRRIHLYDEVFAQLPKLREEAAQQAAAFEQEMLMNLRLGQAEKLGDEGLIASLKKQMEGMGIKITKVPLPSPEGIGLLNHEIDGLVNQLEKAVMAKDIEAQKKLVVDIAKKQAMINAAEKGGYFSGGGVRSMVSERDYFPGYEPYKQLDPATGQVIKVGEMAGKPMLKSQLLTAALDQLMKLDKYASQFLRGAVNPSQLADVLKNIGKYGERFASIVERAGIKGTGDAASAFSGLAAKFENILKNTRNLPEKLAERQKVINDLVAQTKTAMGDFDKSHFALIKELQSEANLHAVDGGLEALAAAMNARSQLKVTEANVMQMLFQLGSQFGVPIAEDQAKEAAGEGKEATPPPQAPAPSPDDAKKKVDEANAQGTN